MFRQEDDPWLWAAERDMDKLGNPKWLKKLFLHPGHVHLRPEEVTNEHFKLTATIIPLIFGLTWAGYPLFHRRFSGWGCLVPSTFLLLVESFVQGDESGSGTMRVELRNGTTATVPMSPIMDVIFSEQRRLKDIGKVTTLRL